MSKHIFPLICLGTIDSWFMFKLQILQAKGWGLHGNEGEICYQLGVPLVVGNGIFWTFQILLSTALYWHHQQRASHRASNYIPKKNYSLLFTILTSILQFYSSSKNADNQQSSQRSQSWISPVRQIQLLFQFPFKGRSLEWWFLYYLTLLFSFISG